MKKISDYKGDDAIELWGDLLGPISNILGDKRIAIIVKSGKPKMAIAQAILKTHKEDVKEIFLRIDDSEINGLNILSRLMNVLNEFESDEDLKSFFGFAEQAGTDSVSTGLPTVITEDDGK